MRVKTLSSLLFGNVPRVVAVAMVIAVSIVGLLHALLRLGDRAAETGHKVLDFLRDLRKYRRGR